LHEAVSDFELKTHDIYSQNHEDLPLNAAIGRFVEPSWHCVNGTMFCMRKARIQEYSHDSKEWGRVLGPKALQQE
jgi:hypothetical protein